MYPLPILDPVRPRGATSEGPARRPIASIFYGRAPRFQAASDLWIANLNRIKWQCQCVFLLDFGEQ